MSLVGTRLDIEHDDLDSGYVYRHVQRLTLGEWTTTVARGISPSWGVELALPVRLARDRIRYETPQGAPYVPTDPDLHHRNETRVGIADPRLLAHAATTRGEWSLAARAGVSIPLGDTEANPFAAGRSGVRHQHVQFGSGTVDPLVMLQLERPAGRMRLHGIGHARFALYENSHGYQAGHRFGAAIATSAPLGAGWSGRVGLDLTREEAETWDGRLEDEGNLGRTDLSIDLAIARAFAPLGSFAVAARISAWSRSTGEQTEQPLILSIDWAR